MNNKYHNENKLNLQNLDLNKTFYHQRKKTNINNYQVSAGKNLPLGIKKDRQIIPIKLTSLIKDEKKSFPKSLNRKIYIISKNKDNQLSFKNTKYKKAKSSLNNNYNETDYNNIEYEENFPNKNGKNINNINNDNIKLIDKSKEENINNKTNSKDKTFCYSANNTFYNTNTNSNTYINNTANNNNILEKENNIPINIIDEKLNLTSNSDNLKSPNINIISASNIKNINHFKKNNIIINDNNTDNYFYGNKTLYEYYLPKEKLNENKKRRENLLIDSRKFYLYCSERGILNKLRQLQSKNIEKELKENGLDFYNKKLNLYSEIRRLPTQVCFRKGNSSLKDEMKDLEIYYKYNNDKFIKKLINKKYKGEAEKKLDNYHKIITNGFPIPINKNKNKFDYILENKLIINSKKEKSFKKNNLIIDQDLYPLLNQKKILKNILPKEADYNTQFTINDIINEELHPLNRYQKKNLTLHSNLISQEIELLFGKNIKIADIPNYSNIYPNRENLIQYKTGEKYNQLLKILSKPEKKEEYINPEIIEDNRKKLLRRRYIYDKIKDTLKKCMLKFKRLRITKNFFWEILYNESYLSYKEGLYIFNAIKDGDITTIEKLVKRNAKYAIFKDEFKQTPLHICAKRNIYQVIQLIISRLGDVNAQDIYGRTPLMCAAQNGNIEFICIILFSFADPSIEDKEGKRAIDYTDNIIIKYTLKYARIIHIFNNMISKLKDFDEFVVRGLTHLFTKEVGLNIKPLLEINDKILNNTDDI